MARTSISSKLIKSIYYDGDTKTLSLEFHTGEPRTYLQVPKAMADALASAPSPGWYYTRHIKGCFPSDRTSLLTRLLTYFRNRLSRSHKRMSRGFR